MLTESNIQMLNTNYRGITRHIHKDWNIEAFNIPRSKIHDKEYTDLNIEGHSIYFLYGEDEQSNLKIYVGRSSDTKKNVPVFTRLHQHNISTSESYRDIWTDVIALKFNELSFDEMRHLENYFYHAIKTEARLNSVEPDTDVYKYDNIKHKVEYIKSFVTFILREDIFKEEKKHEATKEVPRLKYSDAEITNQGKRLVDKDFETVTEIQTPFDVVEEMLDLLPDSVWSPDTKFLDLACKSGEYLKAIFNRLLKSPLYKGTPYEDTVARTLHIVSEQLYGIALSDKSLELSKKNINTNANIIKLDYKVNNVEVELKYILGKFNFLNNEASNLKALKSSSDKKAFNNLYRLFKKNKQDLLDLGITEDTFEELLRNKFKVGKDMRFNVIVGNPPYQENTKTIYNEFINGAIDMRADQIAMIVKNNWLVSDTLKSTRNNMIDYGLVEVINYPKIGDVFSNVSAAVSIFYIENGYSGDTCYSEYIKKQGEMQLESKYSLNLKDSIVILSNKVEQSIVNKFSSICKNSNFGELTYPSEPFRIATNGTVGRGERTYTLPDYAEYSTEHNVAVIYMDSSKKPYLRYVNYNDVPNRKELVSKYKVICGRILTKDKTVIGNIHCVKTNTVCTSSWGLIYASDSEEEALNVEKYIKTKFFRYLVRCLGEDGVIALSPYRFSLVPIQNFTSSSDIDWSKSLTDIDQQLYRKYNLTKEDMDYIENTIQTYDKFKLTQQDYEAAYINKKLNTQN